MPERYTNTFSLETDSNGNVNQNCLVLRIIPLSPIERSRSGPDAKKEAWPLSGICRWDFESAFNRLKSASTCVVSCDATFSPYCLCFTFSIYRGVALIRSTWMRADLTELYASVTVVVTMGYRGESRVSIPPSSPRLASWLSHDALVIRSSLSYTPYQYQYHTSRCMPHHIYHLLCPILHPITLCCPPHTSVSFASIALAASHTHVRNPHRNPCEFSN